MSEFTISTPSLLNSTKQESIDFLSRLKRFILDKKSSLKGKCHVVNTYQMITISSNKKKYDNCTKHECINGIIRFVARIFDDKSEDAVKIRAATKVLISSISDDKISMDELENYLQIVIDATHNIQDKNVVLNGDEEHQNLQFLTELHNPQFDESSVLDDSSDFLSSLRIKEQWWSDLATTKQVLWVILCVVLLFAGIVPGLIAIIALLIYNYIVSKYQVE